MDGRPSIVIDLQQHSVTCDGERVTLQRKTYDLLVFFAQNSGQLLTKDAILRGVWPDTHVTEGSVKDVVKQLRRALSDDPGNPRFVATERGLGYRFLGEVSFSESAESPSVAVQSQVSAIDPLADAASEHWTKAKENRRSWLGLSIWLAIGGVAAVFLFGAVLLLGHGTNTVPDPTIQPTVAVLPFENLSPDPDQDYFAEGITDDLITELSQLSGLFVIAKNSTEIYADRAVPLQRIAKDLSVRYLLQGSVQHDGALLRINAQLVDTENGNNMWAERFDAAASDVLELQARIARRIVETLQVRLSETDAEQLEQIETLSPEAHDYVLRGQLLFRRLTPKDNATAQELLEKALEIDPSYARAEALLGWSRWMATVSGWDRQPLQVALAHANRALAQDDRLTSALSLKGKVLLWQKRHEEAEAQLKKAVSLAPNDYSAQGHLGDILVWSGKTEEAFAPLERSLRLNPSDHGWILTLMGLAHFFAERDEEALQTLDRSLVRNPDYFWAHLARTAVLGQIGRQSEAGLALNKALEVNPEFSLEFLVSVAPFGRERDKVRLVEGLRVAGLEQ